MSLEYAYEKLSVAVTGIATSTDSLQDRLVGAFLAFHPIGLDVKADLPPDLQSQYLQIEKSLTKVQPRGDEGAIRATTRAMSDREAEALIEQIMNLYDEVTQLIGRNSED